jgi:hypothetical protein
MRSIGTIGWFAMRYAAHGPVRPNQPAAKPKAAIPVDVLRKWPLNAIIGNDSGRAFHKASGITRRSALCGEGIAAPIPTVIVGLAPSSVSSRLAAVGD